MFSATFPEEIQRLARDLLNDYVFVTVGRVGGANTDINQTVVQVDQFNKKAVLMDLLANIGGVSFLLLFPVLVSERFYFAFIR